MKKKLIGFIFIILFTIPAFFFIGCSKIEAVELFVNIKRDSSIYDNFKENKLVFTYGDNDVLNITADLFKVMVKLEDESLKLLSNGESENCYKFESTLPSENVPEVGDYSIRFIYGDLVKTFTISVINNKIEKPILVSDQIFVYDGTAKYPTLNNLTTGEEINISGDLSGINAGNYTITVSLNDGYTWSDGTIIPVVINWKIYKRKIIQEELDILQVAIKGENSLETEYSGGVKELEILQLPNYLKITGEKSGSLIGNYKAYFEIADNCLTNYEFEENINNEISWNITKIKIALPTLKYSHMNYIENLNLDVYSIFNEVKFYEDWKTTSLVLSTGNFNNITSVGSYTFKFRILDKAHYCWENYETEDVTITFDVNAVDYNMTWYEEVIWLDSVYNASKILADLEDILKTKMLEKYGDNKELHFDNFTFDNKSLMVGDVGSKIVKAIYKHNSNYNTMKFNVKLNILPYEIAYTNALDWFVDENCTISYDDNIIYNSLEQGIYTKIKNEILNAWRFDVGENFDIEFEYISNKFKNADVYKALVTAKIKENNRIKASNYKLINMKEAEAKTWKISKAIFDPTDVNNLIWSTSNLISGKYVFTYSGKENLINIPVVNYKNILSNNTLDDSGINVLVSYYKNGVKTSPINAGFYEVKFEFSVLEDSNYKIKNNTVITKNLVIEKAVAKNIIAEEVSVYVGEKLKDKKFLVTANDLIGNSLDNITCKIKNEIDGELIPTKSGKIVLELVHDNFKGDVEVCYSVVDLFDKIVVRNLIYNNIYKEITGIEFYSLNAYNLDAIYELSFKTGYEFDVLDFSGEIVENLLNFNDENIFSYKIKDDKNNIVLYMPNIIIDNIVYNPIVYNGNLSETVSILKHGNTTTKKIYDSKFYYTKYVDTPQYEKSSWDEKDYIINYEIGKDITKLTIELENVFMFGNLFNVKLYDINGEEVAHSINSNIFEIDPNVIRRVVVSYKYGTEVTLRTALDLRIFTESIIDNVSFKGFGFDGGELSGIIERSWGITDYICIEDSGIITNLNVNLKDGYRSLGYNIQLVTKDDKDLDLQNQENNSFVYIEIYNKGSLIERRSILLSYNCEFEKIKNNTLKISKTDYYYSVTNKDGLKYLVNENGVYELIDGVLQEKEIYLDYENKFILEVVYTTNYTSLKDDATGEYNLVGDVLLSKEPINIYNGIYFEVYDVNYNKTGELATANLGILTICKLNKFDKNSNDYYRTYYFISDKLKTGDACVYIEDKLVYIAEISEGQYELNMKIAFIFNENLFLIKDKLNVIIK